MGPKVSRILGTASALALLTALAPPVAAAEMNYVIPFSFIVNEATLPPGVYRLSSLHTVLFVRGIGRGAFATTFAIPPERDARAQLVFHKYGDVILLRQAWLDGSAGREIPESRLERTLREEASPRLARRPERVTIPRS